MLTTFILGVIWGLASAIVRHEVKEIGHRPPLVVPVVRPPDRLGETVRVWLADPRPAWETVEAFERDVAHALGVAAPPEPGEFYRQTLIGADGDEVVVTGWRRL